MDLEFEFEFDLRAFLLGVALALVMGYILISGYEAGLLGY